jgi:hypothetical protein
VKLRAETLINRSVGKLTVHLSERRKFTAPTNERKCSNPRLLSYPLLLRNSSSNRIMGTANVGK